MALNRSLFSSILKNILIFRLRSVRCSVSLARRRLFTRRSPSPAAAAAASPGASTLLSSGGRRMAPIPLVGPGRAGQLFHESPELFGSTLGPGSPQVPTESPGSPVPVDLTASGGGPSDGLYGPSLAGKFTLRLYNLMEFKHYVIFRS